MKPRLEDFFARDDPALDLHLEDEPLLVKTLGGSEVVLQGLSSRTTIAEIKKKLADQLSIPVFTIKLVLGSSMLEADPFSLLEVGFSSDTPLVMIRCPGDRAEWIRLFRELINAINYRQPHEARMLVDMGAGLDDKGEILRAGTFMQRPGDWTVGDADPGNTMLHLAIREGLSDLALYLLDRKADVNAVSDNGRSPLMQAVIREQVRTTEALLEKHVDMSISDYLGKNVLDYALQKSNDLVSAKLVPSFSLKEIEASFSRVAPILPSALMKCCANGMPVTAIALIDAHAELDVSDDKGRSILHYAYASGMTDVIAKLLECGIDPTQADVNGFLPQEGVHDVHEEEMEDMEPRNERCWLGQFFALRNS